MIFGINFVITFHMCCEQKISLNLKILELIERDGEKLIRAQIIPTIIDFHCNKECDVHLDDVIEIEASIKIKKDKKSIQTI